MGYVYLLMSVDEMGVETFKIGVTKNDPNLRVKALQTGCPNKITLKDFYETENYFKVEKWLHNIFNQKTEAKNEWRSMNFEQVKSFKEMCTKADENIKFLIENNPFFK